MHIIFEIYSYVSFLLRKIIVALVNLYIMYFRVGLVFRKRRHRPPSMERRDLVVQLAPQSPVNNTLNISNIILTINENFLDRSLWKGLRDVGTQPSAIVTGISYGGIGFYISLHLMLCGVNVHGVGRSLKSLNYAEKMMQYAISRQCKLHKDWSGKVGRLFLHVCDMSDTVAVSNLSSIVLRDKNIRIIVCNAGSLKTTITPRLSSQRLEEHFATIHVGHSLLILRLLQHRLQHKNLSTSLCPHWRIIFVSSASTGAVTNPIIEHIFNSPESELYFRATYNCYKAWGDAEMCKILFALALSKFLDHDDRLSPFVSVNIVDPGLTRICKVQSSSFSFSKFIENKINAIFSISPAVAALYVVDLCLSKRIDAVSGRYFRMGEDQSARLIKLHKMKESRMGFWVNYLLFQGIPEPAVALSLNRQEALWRFTLAYFTSHGLLDAKLFC